jgi:hypothetical protein
MSWYNPASWGQDIAMQQRAADIPDKIFVADGGKYKFGMGYEYSEFEPASLNWSIDNLLYGGYGRQNFITLFYSLPEIFAPVHEIASRVADAEWQLRRNMDDGIDYKNADWNRLTTSPNPLMSHKQLIYQAVCYELLTGANFQYLNRPNTLPQDSLSSVITWLNMPTQHVKIERNERADPYSATTISDLISGYSIGERKFDVKNVMAITNHDLNFGNQVDKFKSPLQGAHLAIKNLLPVYEARGVIYIKRGALGFLVSKKSDESGLISLTKTEQEEAQLNFQDTYGLRGDKNTVGVTRAPVEFVKTSMSIQELQPFDETLADAIAIYKCLRVPRHLVPSKDNSTFSNADADMKAFYADVIIPTANRYAQTQTTTFAIPNRYIWPDFSLVPILQENAKEKSQVNQIDGNVWLQRFTSGICSLNEWLVGIKSDPITGVALYEKKIYEMLPDELEIVKGVMNLKAASTGTPSAKNTTEKPTID